MAGTPIEECARCHHMGNNARNLTATSLLMGCCVHGYLLLLEFATVRLEGRSAKAQAAVISRWQSCAGESIVARWRGNVLIPQLERKCRDGFQDHVYLIVTHKANLQLPTSYPWRHQLGGRVLHSSSTMMNAFIMPASLS